MDFRVEHEIRVIRKVVKHVHGPCLMCEQELEYGARIPRLSVRAADGRENLISRS
jgi:hypothetical protein